MQHIINLMSVIVDVVGIRMVVPVCLTMVIGTLSGMIVALHMTSLKYHSTKRKEYKPGYVKYNDSIRTLSTQQIDAYEIID